MIDFHAHIGNLQREGYPHRPPFTPHACVDRMNREGVDISVLLPLESPEGSWGWFLTEEAIAARDLYPDRFVAFMCIDARYPAVEKLFDIFYHQYGCRGFGEHITGLPFDHELNKVIYRKCDEYGLPMVMDLCSILTDEPGLPRLERCLQEFPNCRFVGHGPYFWANISAPESELGGYPSGPITPGGAVDRLLSEYPNLYADLSAGSGYNAMTRDPEYTQGFIERHWPRLIYGSDICWHNMEVPQLDWLAHLDIPGDWRHAIADGTARKLLGLD